MELWDVMDEKGRLTGRTMERGQPLEAGDYHLVVHVFIINRNGEFLIQKRSMQKEIWPGEWDITGGAVIAGEDSLSGAIREVHEELGIALKPESFSLIKRLYKKSVLLDIWAVYADFLLEDVVMQEGEVDAVRFVSAEEMVKIIFDTGSSDEEYREIIMRFLSSTDR